MAEACGAVAIDINMGCPAKKVTGGLAGSALMRDLDAATRLIAATVSAVKVPVTVKMRLGWDTDCLNAPDLAARAEREGVAMVGAVASRCRPPDGAERQPSRATADRNGDEPRPRRGQTHAP